MDRDELSAESQGMLRILDWLRFELDASTDRRSWAATIGLTSGLRVEPRRIDLSRLPIVLIGEAGEKSDVYTTTRDVAHVVIKGRYRPAMPESMSAEEASSTADDPLTSEAVEKFRATPRRFSSSITRREES